MPAQVQEPGSTEQYTSATSFLAAGEAVSANAWAITPDEGSMLTNDTTATVSVANVVRGKLYTLRNTITTDQGRVVIRDHQIVCEHR